METFNFLITLPLYYLWWNLQAFQYSYWKETIEISEK